MIKLQKNTGNGGAKLKYPINTLYKVGNSFEVRCAKARLKTTVTSWMLRHSKDWIVEFESLPNGKTKVTRIK